MCSIPAQGSALPDDYMLIEFHTLPHGSPPVLALDGGIAAR